MQCPNCGTNNVNDVNSNQCGVYYFNDRGERCCSSSCANPIPEPLPMPKKIIETDINDDAYDFCETLQLLNLSPLQ